MPIPKKIQIAAILESETLTSDIAEALKTSPLTCGDTESPISLDSEVIIKKVDDDDIKKETIQTEYPIPFTKDTQIMEGNGQVFLMHERCKKIDNNFPLISYMVPIREEQKILKPTSLTVKVSDEKVFEIEGIGNVLSRI